MDEWELRGDRAFLVGVLWLLLRTDLGRADVFTDLVADPTDGTLEFTRLGRRLRVSLDWLADDPPAPGPGPDPFIPGTPVWPPVEKKPDE